VSSHDVIVIGGGAAGLFAAGTAGKRGRNVLLLEHQDKVGKKVLISGGGRCNFTNREVSAKNYVSANPHFCRSALAGFSPDDFIALVKKHAIAFHEKTLGQLFCDGSARQIVEMLLSECAEGNVSVQTNCNVEEITHADERFTLKTSNGELACTSLIIACGGLSIPKMGASDFGYRIAKQFGLAMEKSAPALVPFVLTPEERAHYADLQGLAAPSIVSNASIRFAEATLFTHHGLSGPAILQISSYWQPGEEIAIDWSPQKPLFEWLKERKTRGDKLQVHNALAEVLPRRLAEFFHPTPAALQEQSDAKLRALSDAIHRFVVKPLHTTGYDKAEVTRGGVSTSELSQKTMEAKKVRGLFFVGEVVDVTGWLGGYNFQWAWASGYAAGQAA